jgi:hypothetical protein
MFPFSFFPFRGKTGLMRQTSDEKFIDKLVAIPLRITSSSGFSCLATFDGFP